MIYSTNDGAINAFKSASFNDGWIVGTNNGRRSEVHNFLTDHLGSVRQVVAVTVLLIEQNANMALKIADLAYVLETGNITMSGTGAELLANEKIKEAYLGKHR